jgi:hypothetical protein
VNVFRSPHKRQGSVASGVTVVILLALAAGGAWYFVFRSTPVKTVANMLEAMRIGDQRATAEYLTDVTDAEGNLVMGLTRRLAGEPTEEPQYVIGEPEIVDDRATMPVQFPVGGTFRTLTGMESITIPYILHRQERVWLIDIPDTQEEIGQRITDGALDILRRLLPQEDAPEEPERGERHI